MTVTKILQPKSLYLITKEAFFTFCGHTDNEIYVKIINLFASLKSQERKIRSSDKDISNKKQVFIYIEIIKRVVPYGRLTSV